jgi:hypothetical protein
LSDSKKITAVGGVYYEKSLDRYRVQWTEGDKRRTYSNRKREPVETKRLELIGSARNKVQVPELPPFENDPRWWIGVIGQIANTAIEAARIGDDQGQRQLKMLSDTLINLQKAQGPQREYLDAVELLEKLISYLEGTGHRDMVEHAKAQVVSRSIAATLRSGDGPDRSLYSPGDPVPN